MSWNSIRPLRDRTLPKPRMIGLAFAGLALAILLFAWIDGGEEPLRPIVQQVELPESAR